MPPRNGASLISELDRAGIDMAVVLSVGYSLADERKALADPDQLTREENDWTAREVAASRGRLIGLCSANPLRDAAVAELERCLALRGMRGIKQHFGNSGVSLRSADHRARMSRIFSLAQRREVPILVHMRARGGADFGAEDARLFLDHLVTAAPAIPIIIAHLGGAGPGYPDQNDEIMAVFGRAAEQGDRRLRNLYFDVAANVTAESTAADGALVAERIRQVGVNHVLYGSDLSPPGGSVASGWAIFRARVPLTPEEFAIIAGNRLRFTR